MTASSKRMREMLRRRGGGESVCVTAILEDTELQ